MTFQNTMLLYGDSGNNFCSSANSTFGSAGVAPSGNAYEGSFGLFNTWNQSLDFPFRVVSNAGVNGDTTAQMLARLATDCIAVPSNHVFFFTPGSNDTPSGSGLSIQDSIDNLTDMFDAILGDGRTLWVPSIPPRVDFDATALTHAMAINKFLQDYENTHDNFHSADLFPYTQDWSALGSGFVATSHPSQGATADTLDGYHYTSCGTLKALPGLQSEWGAISPFPEYAQDIRGNIAGNPFMEGTTSPSITGFTGNLPPGFWAERSGTIAAVGSLVARSDAEVDFPGLFDQGARGQLTKLVLTGSTANTDQFKLIMYPITGSLPNSSGPWELLCKIGVKATTGKVREANLHAFVYYTGPSQWDFNINALALGYAPDSLNASKYGKAIHSRPFYVPNNITGAQVNAGITLDSAGAATVWIGDFYWRKVGDV